MNQLPDDVLSVIVPYLTDKNFSLVCKRFNKVFQKHRIPTKDEIKNVIDGNDLKAIRALLRNKHCTFFADTDKFLHIFTQVRVFTEEHGLVTTMPVSSNTVKKVLLINSYAKVAHETRIELLYMLCNLNEFKAAFRVLGSMYYAVFTGKVYRKHLN